MTYKGDLYLGFDLSTQQLKIIVTNEKLAHFNTYNVEFDTVFGEKYGVKKGVLTNKTEILSPVLMWLDAIDYVFNLMKEDGFPFHRVVGMSGSGMQHGSIYWSKQAKDALANLDPSKSLSENLESAFTMLTSPNWQDHSTGKEIKDFEQEVGGPDKLAEITGSRAHYRFTGLQIRKLATRANPEKYQETERISLVSSFLASVLLGNITNIEQADACGMNIYDVEKSEYSDKLLAVAAGVDESDKAGIEALRQKLGEIKPITYENDGKVSSYFVHKYGFNPDAKVYSCTGDNLATIVALPLEPNDILISLGTSTTVLLITEKYIPSSQYHLFKHPTMPGHYMGMICYSNGSLAREKVRDDLNEKFNLKKDDWLKFDELLDSSSSFNDKLGVYFPIGEIVPNAGAQTRRFKLDGGLKEVEKWDVEDDVSSIIESQTLSCRLRSGPMLTLNSGESGNDKLVEIYNNIVDKFGTLYTDGKEQTLQSFISKPHKAYFVGGASKNTSILKKMGSILSPTDGNYKVEIANSCALGGAYKASWSHHCEKEGKWVNYNEYISDNFDYKSVEKFEVNDNWNDYFNGMAMLAKIEEQLSN